MALKWTSDQAERLQATVDKIFIEEGGDKISGMKFSFTIADPMIEGCPLIGCSTGFTELCGYEMNEIVGRNCRFLVAPVPLDLVHEPTRRRAREYCEAIRDGKDYNPETTEYPSYLSYPRPRGDGLFFAQSNARKDGTLFKNLFYLKSVNVNDHMYIVGLQCEIPATDQEAEDMREKGEFAAVAKYCRQLDQNWAEVERCLSGLFWIQTVMRRQDDPDEHDGYTAFVGDD